MKSPYPALNVWRRHEPVATDTIHGGTPAVDTGGHTYAQVFIGRKSFVTNIWYGELQGICQHTRG